MLNTVRADRSCRRVAVLHAGISPQGASPDAEESEALKGNKAIKDSSEDLLGGTGQPGCTDCRTAAASWAMMMMMMMMVRRRSEHY